MGKVMPGRKDYFEGFIKTAQYLTGLTTQQDIWSETGKVLVHFFGADVGGFEEKRPDGEAIGRHWTFSERFSSRGDIEAETGETIAEVLESGFLSERIIPMPDPFSMACFPVTQENKVVAVMVAGHGMSEPLPRELLNVYMAVAGLVGTTFTRLVSEQKLQRHREHLGRLAKERTAELTKVNKRLQQEIAEHMQAANALKESQKRFRSVVDNIGIGVALISPNMEILTLNNQMKKWFPYIDVSKKPICYRVYNDPPREAPCSYCPTIKTLQDGEVHESITDTPARDEIRNYRIISSPIKDGGGNVTAAIEMVEDITDRKRAEKALRRREAYFRSIIENSSDIITILTEDCIVRYVSPSLENITGFKPAELTDRDIFDSVHPDDVSSAKDIFARAIQTPGGTISAELRLRHSDSSWHIYEIAIQNLLNNEAVKGIVVNSHDITDRKLVEEEKEKLVVELRESLSKIKTLSGLLPICSWCKKIRDDEGYWQQLESYISTHSKAEFSHSICPDCMKQKYPDIYDEEEKKLIDEM